ncbi:MAG: mechanosensitive ion channel [Xenococcaceae cyanobacterium MO_234.B1]|nr:mechanosensitive ion channel [Xenococcaceae cyanobacterium MO_234.B1]
MFNESDFAPLYDFLTKILIFFERPSFQIQLLAILLGILLAWLLSKVLKSLIQRWELPTYLLETPVQPFLVIIYYLNFPLLGLIAIAFTSQLLLLQGWLVGLLTKVTTLFWTLLFYRLFIGILYAVFSPSFFRPYHYRLFAPLFILYLITEILSYLTNLEPITNIVLTSFFETAITVGSLFKAIVGLYFWVGVLWATQGLLYRLITQQTKAEPGEVEAILTLSRYILIGLGLIMVLSNLGFNTATLAAITGGLSLGIGVGLQEIMGNFISGIMLFFEGALKPGDVVEVEGDISVVKRLSIRATTVQTFNNIEKIVPNQKFFTSSVTTYTGSDRLMRCLIPVGVSYKSEPEAVMEILLKVAQDHPYVLDKPKPVVFLIGFGDYTIDFELAVWLDNPIIQKIVISEVNQAIWKAFAEHNIEIPFPQRDLHIRNIASWEKLNGNQ